MAVTTSSLIPPETATEAALARRVARRRRISPQAGRALEILGHAIEYLTDEYVHRSGSFSARDPELEAVQLLMAVNRAIYLECPEVPSFGARCLRWLGIGIKRD
jgi:hypothetical protein